jgi:hypothetical protein
VGLKLPVLENNVLRRLFGPKKDEKIWPWRKLYNAKLHNASSSSGVIKTAKSKRVYRQACSTHGRKGRRIKICGMKGWRKEPQRRLKSKWVDNIKMSLKQERIVWTGFMWLWIRTNSEFWAHGNEPSESLTRWAPIDFSRTSLHVVSRMLVKTNVIQNYDYVHIQRLDHVSKHFYNLYLSIAILKYRNPGSNKGFTNL